MKRYWSTPDYLLHQKRRIAKAERRREATHGRQFRSARRPQGQQIDLIAPSELSVFDKPDDTLKFCNDLREALRGVNTKVYLNLGPVTQFSSDALLLVRAIMDGGTRWSNNNVGGNMPTDLEIASKFKESGFFHGFAKPPGGKLPPPKGLMRKKSEWLVFSAVADDLVTFALSHTSPKHGCPEASYRTLVEAMTNTHNHARAGSKHDPHAKRTRLNRERWHTSVYCEGGNAAFTFIDLGVGILQSSHARQFLKMLGIRADLYGHSRLLREVFQGIIGSSTGLPGRGLGLPRMKKDTDGGLLPNLRTLTSDVVMNVAELKCETFSVPFRGTILRWDIGVTGVSS